MTAVAIAAREHPALLGILEELTVVFDLAYYRDQLATHFPDELEELEGGETSRLVMHYIERGWRLGLNPNPLFDSEYYLQQNPECADAAQNPLFDFLAENRPEFHPLFEVDEFRSAAERGGIEVDGEVNPLVSYLRLEPAERPCPTLSFDPDFYREVNHDSSLEGADALVHYLTAGYKQGWWPAPAFDPACFARSTGRSTTAVPARPPLVDWLITPISSRPNALDLLDPGDYRALHPDLARLNLHPATHFLRHGVAEGRSPEPDPLARLHPRAGPAAKLQ